MFRPFSFLPTDHSKPEGRNWRVFDEATKVKPFTPTIVGGTVTPVPGAGMWVLYGPITFFTVPIVLNNNDGWLTTSVMTMPFNEAQNQIDVRVGYYNFPVFNVVTGVQITTAYLSTTAGTTTLKFAAAYTNTSGADQTIGIQGWYFRN